MPTSIEWTDESWNPVRGCDKVSAGCKNCYAETFSERWRGIKGHPFEQGFDLRLVPEKLDQPLRWKRGRRIFVNSMSDLFHEGVSFEYIAAVFGVMAACPWHTFQVLTKRAERMREFFKWLDERRDAGSGRWNSFAEVCRHFAMETIEHRRPDGSALPGPTQALFGYDTRWPLPNVHLGVSCEDQETADQRIPLLLLCPAAVRFVSFEPLLGPISFRLPAVSDPPEDVPSFGSANPQEWDDWKYWAARNRGIDWAIVGGESGRGARPCDLAWIRAIVEQCKAGHVPVFVKQDTGPRPGMQGRIPDDLWIKEFPREAA